MAGNEVKLIFAGDSTSLERTFKNVSSGADTMTSNVKSSTSSLKGGFDDVAGGIDDSERKFRGLGDTINGTSGIMQSFKDGDIVGVAMGFADLAGGVTDFVVPAIKSLAGKFGLMTAATVTQTGATEGATVAQSGLNAALLANPIGAVILAIGALIAIGYLVIRNWDTIKEAFSATWNWIKDHWQLLLGILTGPIGLAVLAITKNWDTIKSGFTAVKDWIGNRIGDIVGFVTGLPGRIASAASGMWDGIKDSFKAAINWIIDAWNGFGFRIGGWKINGPLGTSVTLPTIDVRMPHIPRFHDGGVVPGAPGSEMLAMLQAGETVIPNGGGSGGVTINVNIPAEGDPDAVARAAVQRIEAYFRRSGRAWAAA